MPLIQTNCRSKHVTTPLRWHPGPEKILTGEYQDKYKANTEGEMEDSFFDERWAASYWSTVLILFRLVRQLLMAVWNSASRGALEEQDSRKLRLLLQHDGWQLDNMSAFYGLFRKANESMKQTWWTQVLLGLLGSACVRARARHVHCSGARVGLLHAMLAVFSLFCSLRSDCFVLVVVLFSASLCNCLVL